MKLPRLAEPDLVEIPNGGALAENSFIIWELSVRKGPLAEALRIALGDVQSWIELQAVSTRNRRKHLARLREERSLSPADAGELGTTLLVLLEAVRRKPEDTSEVIALCCHRIAVWASELRAADTALAFAQAAWEAHPENAAFAYEVGWCMRAHELCRDTYARWFAYAAQEAREQKRWKTCAQALLALGEYSRSRSPGLASRCFHAAAGFARRAGSPTLRGDAFVELAALATRRGDFERARQNVVAALDAYGEGHARIPALVMDVATVAMDRCGYFASALALYTAVLSYVWMPAEQLLLHALLGRAAAGAGHVKLFEYAWTQVWARVGTDSSTEGHAAALVQVALGAGALTQWDRARLAAAEAFTLANETDQATTRFQAEQIIAACDDLPGSADALAGVFPDLKYPRPHKEPDCLHDLVDRLLEALVVRRQEVPRGPVQELLLGGRPQW